MRLLLLLLAALALAAALPARPVAAQPTAPPSFTHVTTGYGFTCALAEGGQAFCWGLNERGQLGTTRSGESCQALTWQGGRACSPRPVPAGGALRFRALEAGGSHACGLTAEGAAYCWGEDEWGQLGAPGAERCLVDRGTPGSAATQARYAACSPTPLPLPGGHRFRSLSASDRTTCGVTEEGRVLCWGLRYGERGTGPHAAGGDRRYVSVASGAEGACGLTAGGEAFCWVSETRDSAERVAVPVPLAEVSHGYFHACALDREGGAWCWGKNYLGHAGTGEVSPYEQPVPPARVAGEHRFRALHASQGGTCALDADGAPWCWGRADPVAPTPDRCESSMGALPCALRPVRALPTPAALRSLRATLLFHAHACGLAAEGRLLCWGDNDTGALGDGTTQRRRLSARSVPRRASPATARSRSGPARRARTTCPRPPPPPPRGA